MTDRQPSPRRTCPACSRRYAGLVAPDCPVCQGLGVLTLGAAALHHYDPAPVARAIELYLEANARRARTELPLGQHRQALEASVDELRLAGVLATVHDSTGYPAHHRPRDATASTVAELDAYRATKALGTHVDPAVLHALNAPELPLEYARPRDGRPPQASATGNPTAIATIADPIDPLGPDTGVLAIELATHTHRARVIAAAVPHAVLLQETPPMTNTRDCHTCQQVRPGGGVCPTPLTPQCAQTDRSWCAACPVMDHKHRHRQESTR